MHKDNFMEIKGKIIQVLEEQTGNGKNGQWRKNKFVVEIPGQYPKQVAIDVWGEKFDQMPVKVGNDVTAQIDVESREWKGNWYTDVKAWKVELSGAQQASSTPQSTTPPFQTDDVPAGKEPDYDDDPFDDELLF